MSKSSPSSETSSPMGTCMELDNLHFVGELNLSATLSEHRLTAVELQKRFPEVQNGHWQPKDCVAQHNVGIILPYRDRKKHLILWLLHVIPVLQRQRLNFTIVVVEQNGSEMFNKGHLFNAGFKYILSNVRNVSCVMFHDIDLLPEDDRVSYGCRAMPYHIGAFVSSLNYSILYHRMVGGVLSMSVQHFKLINGYSNHYWGWGGEDDDMGIRILTNNLTIERPENQLYRFFMLPHKSRWKNEAKVGRYKLLDSAHKRWKDDGLSSLDAKSLLQIEIKQLYHHIWINVGVRNETDTFTDYEALQRKRQSEERRHESWSQRRQRAYESAVRAFSARYYHRPLVN